MMAQPMMTSADPNMMMAGQVQGQMPGQMMGQQTQPQPAFLQSEFLWGCFAFSSIHSYSITIKF